MRTGIAICLVACLAEYAGACQPPHFRAGATLLDKPNSVVQNISMPLRDFGPRKLVCLATSLREMYRNRSSVLVYVFSSHEESRAVFFPLELTGSGTKVFQQVHAIYSFDAAKHEEYVKVLPAGLWYSALPMDGADSTTINLPTAAEPHCRLEIDNRCLVAMDHVVYPDQALRRKHSGMVVLTATITRGGKIGNVRVVETEPAPQEALLATAAVQAISSWQMEPGPRENAIQITFSYAIDSSLRYVDGAQVDWALPNKVIIRQNPPD